MQEYIPHPPVRDMYGSTKNGRYAAAVMCPSAVTGHCLLIRDGFGSPAIGHMSVGVSIGSGVTGPGGKEPK